MLYPKLKDKQYEQKTSPNKYRTEIKVLPYPFNRALNKPAPGADLGGGYRGCAAPSEMKSSSSYSFLKCVYLTGQ